MLFLFVMCTSNWSELVCARLNWPQPTKVDADVMHQAWSGVESPTVTVSH